MFIEMSYLVTRLFVTITGLSQTIAAGGGGGGGGPFSSFSSSRGPVSVLIKLTCILKMSLFGMFQREN